MAVTHAREKNKKFFSSKCFFFLLEITRSQILREKELLFRIKHTSSKVTSLSF
jgi:hypothetical protein